MPVGKGSIENMCVYIHMYIYIINIYIYVCAYILYTYIYTYIFKERECSKILFANVVDNVKLIKHFLTPYTKITLYCGYSSLYVGLYRWLVKVSWLGKLVSVFWWVELYFFSLECNEMSSNEL